ncbi:hypothetical protein V6N13_136864 [Hibiscus sabdariffa]|uniref:Chloride channel protein n=1 Tax=Hibiscus sabdariffa TaxID=183260 RepID=A0ABR2DMB8_9ROSI
MAGGGGEFSDQRHLLRSNSHKDEEHDDEENPDDMESQLAYNNNNNNNNSNNAGINDLVKYLGKGFSARRLSFKRLDRDRDRDGDRGKERSSPSSLDHHHHDHHHSYAGDAADPLGDSAPPEWALLLIGCLLGVASGFFVAAFNTGVHVIHEWAWAGTPTEGAAWLRLQRLADTWHRILLVPVTGGVIVGMMHGLLEILNQIQQSSSSQQQGFSLVAGVFPTVKAIQAAITLGTGCSLGPEGPSVDIGKSCANGFSLMMENNRERKIALVAAGAASGIASGFNAAVAGCFFAIETVLRPLRAENSPPFTTAMIILASVISSTVSNALLGTESAFTVPSYDLKSAAAAFEYIKEKFGLPAVICPALGGLGAGIIALKYPGILYWGFTNVNEILHTGKSASAPGIWLLTQLAAAKVVATALCKGSGLVGGLYAPSLMIGAAVGAVFGGSAAEIINSAIPGNAAVAQPQAYALVGMAATLASVCSVPLTSVLLLFELTKDYRILLPLMGAVGLAIWVPSVANQHKETEASDSRNSARGYSSVSAAEELSVMEKAADLEVLDEDIVLEELRVSMAVTVKEAVKRMHDSHQKCALVVDDDDFLEGILTFGDIRRCLSKKPSDVSKGDSTAPDVNACLVSSVCTKGISYRGQERGVLTCFPETDLAMARELMEASGVKQLPVVKRGREPRKGRKRRVIAILHYDSIWNCLREEINHRKSMYQHAHRKDNQEEIVNANGH